MSFYAGVVPADGISAQASVISRTHPQISPGAISPPAAQFSAYGAPITPAQAYAHSVLSAQAQPRSVRSAQPTLQYIIERQQPPNTSVQQPASLLQSPVETSTSVRGQSYAQRLYSSALGKQRQPQSTLQADNRELSSSGPGSPGPDVQFLAPGMPSRPHGARPRAVSSLLLNTSHTNLSSPQPVSALDFYHSSVSKLGLQSPPDQSTRPAGPRRHQSVMSSSPRVSIPHSPLPLVSPTSQAPYDIQAPTRGGTVILSSERDHRLSTPTELRSVSPPNLVPPLPGRFASPDSDQISSRSVSLCSNIVLSPVSSELLPRELSPNSEGHSGDIPSRPESTIPSSHLAPIPIRSASPDLSPEDVPSYSLVDDTPPPPDFDESQSICNVNPLPSVNHAEVPVVLSPPDAPSPSPSPPPHEPGAIYRAVPLMGTSPNLSPDPSLESPRPTSAMEGVPVYYPEQTLVCVAEKLYGYPVEDLVPRLPEKAQLYAAKEPLSYKQREHNTSSNDIQCPPASSAVATHYKSASNNSANTTAPPPAPPPTLLAFSTQPITTSAPSPTLPTPSPSLSPKPSTVNLVNVQPATSLPLRSDNTIQRSIPPPLPPRIRSESKSSPSSALLPSSLSGPAVMPSQPYPTVSYSHFPSPFPQYSQARSVPPIPSTSNRPADVRPQLSSPLSHVWPGAAQVSYQSPLQGFQTQASSPPPQHPRAQNVTAPSPQTSRNLGSITAGIAGGALGLLGGAVLAEALGGDDIVDDLAGNMAGMTFGDPTGGFLDDQFSGSGFDPTAGFQGDQAFSGDSFVPTYDMTDPNMGCGLDSYQTAGYQEQPSMLPDPYFASEQVQETQQSDITGTYNMSQYQQQPNDQNGTGTGGTHYMHDAEQILQAAYKIYHAAQQSGVAQGSQNPQTTAPLQQSVSANPEVSLSGGLPISQSIGHIPTSSTGQNAGLHASFASVPFHGAPFSPTATQHNGQFATSTTIQPPAATTFSQHHPSVHPVSQQINHSPSHNHAFTQGSHTQNSHINHTTYPSSGNAPYTVSSHGPMQAQHIMHYGTGSSHGTPSHHTSTQSHAHGQHSTHPGSYLPQGSSQQQSHAAQHPSSASTAQNKATLARQVVKGALIAGGVLAKYNKLTGGQGFVGNDGGFS